MDVGWEHGTKLFQVLLLLDSQIHVDFGPVKTHLGLLLLRKQRWLLAWSSFGWRGLRGVRLLLVLFKVLSNIWCQNEVRVLTVMFVGCWKATDD